MRTFGVVLISPGCDFASGVGQIMEPVGIQAFIAQSPIEAFDMAVLHWPARLYVDQADLLLFRPAKDMSTGQFRPVVPAEWSWRGTVRLAIPEWRIRRRRDATGAPTQGPESLGAAQAVPEIP
jgi:hypothetical protein